METITLETESYLVEGKENERFFPFLELEFNEDVIYENNIPKYYLSFSEDLKSAYGIGKWIMTELEKNNHDLRKTITLLGQSMNLNWDIFSTNVGKQIDDSWKSEKIELTILTDNIIEKIKRTTTMYNRNYGGFDYVRIHSELQASVLNRKP